MATLESVTVHLQMQCTQSDLEFRTLAGWSTNSQLPFGFSGTNTVYSATKTMTSANVDYPSANAVSELDLDRGAAWNAFATGN